MIAVGVERTGQDRVELACGLGREADLKLGRILS